MSEPFNPAHLRIRSCVIRNASGTLLDIRHMLTEFSVFSDLMTPYTRFEALIVDSLGLCEFLPLVGDELLSLSFGTSESQSEVTDYIFALTAVENRKKALARSDIYTLTGFSTQAILNERASIDISYRRLSASDMVRAICRDYLGNTPVVLEETQGLHSLSFAGVRPHDALRTIASEAHIEGTSSALLYYERDWKTSEFVSIATLIERATIESYYFAHANIDSAAVRDASKSAYTRGEAGKRINPARSQENDRKAYPYRKIISFEYKTMFNTMRNIRRGVYETHIEAIDPLIKGYRKSSFVYGESFDALSHVEKASIQTSSSRLTTPSASGFSKSEFLLSNFRESYPASWIAADDLRTEGPSRRHEFAALESAQRSSISSHIVEVTVPGNIALRVGNMIELNIPQNTQVEEYAQRNNVMIGERYLISAVRHSYNKRENAFYTVLECVKDSYARAPREYGRYIKLSERASQGFGDIGT